MSAREELLEAIETMSEDELEELLECAKRLKVPQFGNDNYPPLIHEPKEESAVIFLLGLLWHHLNVRFSFEKFEVPPQEQAAETKWLDARGHYFQDDQWKPATFEFKLKSSGLLRDAQRHSSLKVDWLICWENDAPAIINRYANNVLVLRRVWEGLPEKLRRRLIGTTYDDPSPCPCKTDPLAAVATLPPKQRSLVERMLSGWPKSPKLGEREIMLVGQGVGRKVQTLIRICPAYRTPHIIVKPAANLPETFLMRLGELPGLEQLSKEGISIPLDSLTEELVDEMMSLLRKNEQK